MGSQLQGLGGVAPHPCLAALISRSPIPEVRVPKELPPTCLEAKQLGWCVSLFGIPLVEGGGALFASCLSVPLNKPIPRKNRALPTQIPRRFCLPDLGVARIPAVLAVSQTWLCDPGSKFTTSAGCFAVPKRGGFLCL